VKAIPKHFNSEYHATAVKLVTSKCNNNNRTKIKRGKTTVGRIPFVDKQ
jgi:hypothetical protein